MGTNTAKARNELQCEGDFPHVTDKDVVLVDVECCPKYFHLDALLPCVSIFERDVLHIEPRVVSVAFQVPLECE